MAGTAIRSSPYAEIALDGWIAARRALVRTALLCGYDRQSCPRICMQLFHDSADIVLDGAFRQEHDAGDLAVAHALRDQIENSFLLLAQRFRGALSLGRRAVRIARVLGGFREPPELIHDLARNLRREPRLAAPKSTNRLEQLLLRDV